MLSYLIVGSGYRSEYFARVAADHPDLFRALFLCRSSEKASLKTKNTGVPATISPAEGAAFRPDFVVVAVDRDHLAPVAEEWLERGFPVVVETPVGATLSQLERLTALAAQGARIVCCEQYHRHPLLAAGFEAVAGGLIGEPRSAYLSLAHDYHAASLIRRMLLTQGEGYTLRGARSAAPVTETDSRYGAILDGREAVETRDQVIVTFDSGKTAVYDFASTQYRSFIRSRHLTVRGSRGEWSDALIYHLDGDNTPRRALLMPEIPPKYRCLDTQGLRDLRKTWRNELFIDTLLDEYAIATILLDMGDYLAGGPSPYPLEEAVEDARFWLLLSEAVKRPWQAVRRER